MKIKKFAVIICLLLVLMFTGCSSKYTFNYDTVTISSVTVITMHGGDNKENKLNKEDWNSLIEDLNGLNYKSYSGDIKGTSVYQIVIRFSTGDEEIIDAYRIRKTDNKPQKFQCKESEYKKVVEKYIIAK